MTILNFLATIIYFENIVIRVSIFISLFVTYRNEIIITELQFIPKQRTLIYFPIYLLIYTHWVPRRNSFANIKLSLNNNFHWFNLPKIIHIHAERFSIISFNFFIFNCMKVSRFLNNVFYFANLMPALTMYKINKIK